MRKLRGIDANSLFSTVMDKSDCPEPISKWVSPAAQAVPIPGTSAEIEIGPEVVVRPEITGMMLRFQSREGRAIPTKAVVTAEIHAERAMGAPTIRRQPEVEINRPETEIMSGQVVSSSRVAAVGSYSQSVTDASGIEVESLSGYSLPARQEPEIVAFSSPTIFFTITI